MLSLSQLSTMMQHAITLAKYGPDDDLNPQVGCVIVADDGLIVAEGFHAGSGTDHAEVAALAKLDPALNPSTLTAVITLEPCNHTGKTPPCVEALHASGIGTIVFGQPDLGQNSSGGATELFARGHHVIGGIASKATAELLANWRQRTGQPRGRVIAKWAQSLDGRLAAADGTSQWITSAKALRHVHIQRALADVIITTTATVAADNPALTARTQAGELLVPTCDQPLPVIFGTGDTDPKAIIHSHPALGHRGLTVAPQFSGQNLVAELTQLEDLVGPAPRILIEAGPTFITGILTQQLVNELLIYTAPILLGGPHHAVADLDIATLTGSQQYHFSNIHCLDTDMVSTLLKEH